MDSDPLDGASASSGFASSPNTAILNYLFPGFSVVNTAITTYLGFDLTAYLPLVLVILGIHVVWRHFRDSLWSLVTDYLMSSVRIRTDDEIYNMVMLWLSKQGFARRSRHVFANTDLNSRSLGFYLYHGDDEDDADDADDGDAATVASSSSKKKAVHYTPAFGMHYFWYKGHPLIFERIQNREQSNWQSLSEREELSLSCLGRNPRILKQLLLDARELHMDRDERKTLIYRANFVETHWQRCMSRLNRPFSTVTLKESAKRQLLDDAADYLDPATRRWYTNRGIPYRRGYLLHGPPGTGKSSLSLALAGFFRMKIYILRLSSAAASEENITALFNKLPTRCIVLLEDIDAAGLTHSRGDHASVSPSTSAAAATPAASAGRRPGPHSSSPADRLSLSGLLNVLDGVASQEGRILVMTTNHIEKLDKALVRPGRVDMTIDFGLADAEMAASIFRPIYAPFDDELAPRTSMTLDDGYSSEEERKRRTEERSRVCNNVDGLAQRFAAKIPRGEFSPAEVQGLLLRFKRNPEAAISAVEDLVTRTRIEKRQHAEEEALKREEEARRREKEAERKRRRKAKKAAKKRTKGDGKDRNDTSSSEDSSMDSSESSESLRLAPSEPESDEGAEKKEGKERARRGSEVTVKIKAKPRTIKPEAGSDLSKPSSVTASQQQLAAAKVKAASDSGYEPR